MKVQQHGLCTKPSLLSGSFRSDATQGLIYSTRFSPPKGKHEISYHKGKDCWWLRRHRRHFYQPHRPCEDGGQDTTGPQGETHWECLLHKGQNPDNKV